MSQSYSLKSSHPHLLPQNPKVFFTSVSLLLSRIWGHCYHLSKFHIYTYVNILYWCFSFWLSSLCIIGTRFIHLIRTDSNVFHFIDELIFDCIHTPQLPYSFICWWISRLLPCSGCYKQCCNEHWGIRVSFNSGFLSVYAQQWDCWVIWQFYFQIFEGISTLFSIAAVLVYIPTNSVRGFPFLHTLSSIYCL